MDQKQEFEKLHAKLDAMDTKLDSHLERIAKVETESGFVKIGVLGIISWIAAKFYMFKG